MKQVIYKYPLDQITPVPAGEIVMIGPDSGHAFPTVWIRHAENESQ